MQNDASGCILVSAKLTRQEPSEKPMSSRVALLAFCCALLGAAPPPPKSTYSDAELRDIGGSSTEMRPWIERFTADRLSLNRSYSTEVLGPGARGGAPSNDLSPGRRDRMREFYSEWLVQLSKVNFEGLGQDGRVDYVLFHNYLEHELRQLDLQVKVRQETAGVIPFAQVILALD